jgi:predicted metal-dependent peptidase
LEDNLATAIAEEVLPLQDIEERWRYIMASMIMGDLFVHEFLMMMSKRPNALIPTMRVWCEGTRIFLEYNPIFMQKLTDEQVRWVLHHEVLHVALHHCTLRAPVDMKNRTLWNWAADLAINQLIKESSMVVRPVGKNIGKPLFPEQYNFPVKLSMEQYLQLLWKWQEEQEKNQEQEKGDSEGQGDQSEPGDQDGDGEGQGSDDQAGDGNGKPSKDQVPQAPDGGKLVDDHGNWEENDLVDQLIRTKIDQMLNQSKYWGHMTGECKAAIELAQKARVNWRKMLRHQLGRFAIDEKEPTILRPNRRFGYPFLGTTNICVDRILVAWDTSGSVGDKALAQFGAECNRAKEYCPIDVCQFDTQITVMPKPFDRKMKRVEVAGRGGTHFQLVFELADKMRYKALVILTDGEAEAPSRPKYVKDIIWCLVGTGDPPVDWGRKIRIKESALDF